MITIGQIAEMAGVSKSTVSRVLNSSGYVHRETREKIEKIIKEYHYSPSAAAQNLSRQDTNTIGIVVPELENPFFSEVLAGVSEVADANNLTMLLCNTGNDLEKEREALRMMEQQRVRGVIFTPACGYSDEQASRTVRHQLKNLKVPVVLVDREIERVQWDGVFYENVRSAYLATKRLINKGCRTIGIITGDPELKHGRERYQGYVQALTESGLPFDRDFVYEGNYTVERACRITKQILASEKRPDGLMLSNNMTMLGFMKGMSECRKEFGQEIQTVCIDHIPVLDLIGFRYDCVTRDARAMGRAAMELLLDRFRNPERERKEQIVPCVEKFTE